MTFDAPTGEQIPKLLTLWKTVFGEYGGFWEMFLDTAFAQSRCRCMTENGQITASLCWFDCTLEGHPVAYIYAVVTRPDHRGKGLCRALMADTHRHLWENGYAAALLVPAEKPLRAMYRKLGYRECTAVREFTCTAENPPVPLRAIGSGEYAALRRTFLPQNSILQEGENLKFLSQQAQFYAGTDVLLAAYQEDGILHSPELLGNPAAAPGIVAALECNTGHFRAPGSDIPFAMYHPLTEDAPTPQYFGFAFD